MGGEEGGANTIQFQHSRGFLEYLRLEGGAAEDEGMSSSGSLDRLRPLRPTGPLFAADMWGRSGELRGD